MFGLFTSTLASSVRFWRGTAVSQNAVPAPELLILYEREGCAACRLVREALTELNLDVEIRPCPIGGERFGAEVKSGRIPHLVDPNTETELNGPRPIIEYLFKQYSGKKPPARLQASLLNLLTSQAATYIRGRAGVYSSPAKPVAEPLVLYSFESSPYSRPVREVLSELELPYVLHNIGKQQLSDYGPAALRFNLGAYHPKPDSKREQFLKDHQRVQVPYLEDPNTGEALFESGTIVAYLNKTYRA